MEVWEQIAAREEGSEVSAVRMGISGGGPLLGPMAHWRAWESLDGFRPASAMDLSGEDGTLRNLRASRTTYLPVNPETPRITASYRGLFIASMVQGYGRKEDKLMCCAAIFTYLKTLKPQQSVTLLNGKIFK
ncbi:hypothetical protein AHAS_Ahas14G0229300 [Arachis hypogaea]